MFQTKVVQKIKAHILLSMVIILENRGNSITGLDRP